MIRIIKQMGMLFLFENHFVIEKHLIRFAGRTKETPEGELYGSP